MSSQLKNILRNSIGLLIGAFFLYLALRKNPLGPVWKSLENVNYFYILLSFICLFVIFYLRALRWKLLLQEAGQDPKGSKVLTSVLLGYFVNSFTPKLGEIIRCTSLQKSTDIPVSVSIGSVMAERAYDLLILLIGILAIFWIEFEKLELIIDSTMRGISELGHNYTYLAGFALVLLILLYFFGIKRLKKSESKPIKKVIEFIQSMLESLKQGILLKQRFLFILLTLLIWSMLVLLNYIYMLCLPETSTFTIGFAVVTLFIGGIGWALPSPGGIGTTHFLILQLFIVYNLSTTAGISYGILSNGLTFIGTILMGSYGYYNYRMEIKYRK
ncbi:lysylphosphatidylglycerol synthase transmembrane domain-containing protein [Labilibaculum sp.]|uniref:lysylphosphatidylglycerol synthase transmembrane domain-containing protein n=1 Tax=Labilibaculum sp. TaxID=2060723 RepID=UPI0035640BFC